MKQQLPKTRNIQDYRLFALGIKKSAGKAWSILTSEDFSRELGITLLQAARLFSRLCAQNRIQQLKRGLYLTPGTSPSFSKQWAPSAYEAVYAYMTWLEANWQITGLASFSQHGFSTQVPQVITVYNDKVSEILETGAGRFDFIKRPKDKLGHKSFCPMYGNIEIPFSSKGRTIFDAIHDAKRFGSLPTAYTWIKWALEIEKETEVIEELIQCCLTYGNKQTISRVGFVLEFLNRDASALAKTLEQKKSSTLIPLVPFVKDLPGERSGVINRRWNIIENKPLTHIFSAMEIPDEDEAV